MDAAYTRTFTVFVGSYLQSCGELLADEKEGKNTLNDNYYYLTLIHLTDNKFLSLANGDCDCGMKRRSKFI